VKRQKCALIRGQNFLKVYPILPPIALDEAALKAENNDIIRDLKLRKPGGSRRRGKFFKTRSYR
jgi:hypothetical protein